MKKILDFDERTRGKQWYDKMKADPTRYKVFRQKENERHRQYIANMRESYRREKERDKEQDEKTINNALNYERNDIFLENEVLSNMLSQIYQIKWEDRQLRDVWEIITRLRKLGASIE